jgi:multidrug resistance efflux pump
MLLRLALIAAVATGLGALLWWSQQRPDSLRVSGFIEADEIRLGSRVGGRVQKVHVEEGQPTEVGSALVELEPFDLLERRAEAQALLSAARAELDRYEAGFRDEEIAQAKAHRDELAARLAKLKAGPRKQTVEAARARLQAARSQLKLAQQNFERIELTFRRNASTQAELDQASEQINAATATVTVREQELAELEEGTRAEEILEAEAQLEEAEQQWILRKSGYRPEEIDEARARVEAAQAALQSIGRQIEELIVRSPVSGTVEAIELQPGDLVAAGAPVLAVLDTSRLWIRTYIPENRLDLQPGGNVRVTIDSFPNEQFSGHISFVSREAEFTPSNIQTPEERSKQVFRAKVTLSGDTERLRPGMEGTVHFDDVESP